MSISKQTGECVYCVYFLIRGSFFSRFGKLSSEVLVGTRSCPRARKRSMKKMLDLVLSALDL